MRDYQDYLDYEPELLFEELDGMSLTKDTDEHVKFISYDGSWPNQCSGILTLEVDGKTYVFGPDYKKPKDCEVLHDIFWHSTGSCGFMGGDYNEPRITKGPWGINIRKLPKEIQKYAIEISRKINENVDWGCCGGCL